MRAARRAAAAAALLSALAPAALACGACDEDRIAAAYDHAVVRDAAARSRAVVFCELGGTRDAARLRAAAQRVRGVDPASLRVSGNPAALSFALDVARQQPESAVRALQQAAPRGTRLHILRVLGPAPQPKAAAGARPPA